MSNSKLNSQNTSGIVYTKGDIIFWDYQDWNILQITITEISIIGEYTNSDGPWFDDWFVVFVSRDSNWQSIPMDVDGLFKVLEYLSIQFQSRVDEFMLGNSSQWNSVVTYPESLKGKTLFKLTPTAEYKQPKTIPDKLLSSLGFGNFNTTQDIGLSDEIKQFLDNAGR